MELTASTADTYVRWAYEQILDVADRLGDTLVNERPPGPATNTVTHLITHCCGVSEFWLGHVGLGRPSARDRDSEFTATATVAELHALVEGTVAQITADLRSLDAGEASATNFDGRQFLQDGDDSDASLVLHVLEELYQHLGQMELTADAFGAPPRTLD
jgi:uncharacterized damage-inducible protein DinB